VRPDSASLAAGSGSAAATSVPPPAKRWTWNQEPHASDRDRAAGRVLPLQGGSEAGAIVDASYRERAALTAFAVEWRPA
jgi:hypothetical protein